MVECALLFDNIAQRIFRDRRRPVFSWLPQQVLRQPRQWVSWLLHDSCYDGAVFDRVLHDVFGDRYLFRGNSSLDMLTTSRSKIAVVATSIAPQTDTAVFGNFNTVQDVMDEYGKGKSRRGE